VYTTESHQAESQQNVQSYALLARTNATIFQVACHLMRRKRVFLCIGGEKGYGFSDVLDTAYVLGGDIKRVTNPFLKRFKNGASLIRYADKTGNNEISTRIKIIQSIGGPDIVVPMCKRLIEKSKQHEAQYGSMTSTHHRMNLVHLGTVHKAKGLEYNNLILADDFVDLNDRELKEKVRRQVRGFVDEFNIIYVAVTRAKRRLRIGPSLAGFLNLTGMLTGIKMCVRRSNSDNDSDCILCRGRSHQKHDGTSRISELKVNLITMSGRSHQFVCPPCLEKQIPHLKVL